MCGEGRVALHAGRFYMQYYQKISGRLGIRARGYIPDDMKVDPQHLFDKVVEHMEASLATETARSGYCLHLPGGG